MHIPTRLRPDRLPRLLALAGGSTWIVKIVLIWQNGGANRFDGTVGLVFMLGAVLLAAAALLWAWHATRARSFLIRGGVLLGALAGLFLAMNLPTLLGQTLFPGSWLAEELGVILVAVVAIAASATTWPDRASRIG